MVDSDGARPLEAVSAVPFVTSAPELSGVDAMSGVTAWVWGTSAFSPLPPAVMRSVSVTDFLSDPPVV
jgi:hypothetical protein